MIPPDRRITGWIIDDDRTEFIDPSTGLVHLIIIHSQTITCHNQFGAIQGSLTIPSPWNFKSAWLNTLIQCPVLNP